MGIDDSQKKLCIDIIASIHDSKKGNARLKTNKRKAFAIESFTLYYNNIIDASMVDLVRPNFFVAMVSNNH